jgi:hypothetical protein
LAYIWGIAKGETQMTSDKHAREAAVEAIVKMGRDARAKGEPMHRNPFDYRWEAVNAILWDQGWKEAA